MTSLIKEAIERVYENITHHGTSYDDEFNMFVYHIEKQYKLKDLSQTDIMWLKGIFQYKPQAYRCGRSRLHGSNKS